jgi:hemerythrin superfamily protein
MNAIKLLKRDHRIVEALFKQFEKAGPKAYTEKKEIVRWIVKELSIHAAIEEAVLYPAARACDEALKDEVLEALEEHHVAKWTLKELEQMSPEDERYTAKVNVLMENIRHHVKEEESELFPKIEQRMGKVELDALGAALEQAKKKVPRHPHPMSPDTPPGNLLSDAVARILDAGRDAVRAGGRRALKTVAQVASHTARRTPAKKRTRSPAPAH